MLCAARNSSGAVYVDDLNFAIWQDPDDGDIPLALDLDRSALRVILAHQVVFTVADFSDFGFFHEMCLLCFFVAPNIPQIGWVLGIWSKVESDGKKCERLVGAIQGHNSYGILKAIPHEGRDEGALPRFYSERRYC